MGQTKAKTYTAAIRAAVGQKAVRGVKTVKEIGQAYGVQLGPGGAV